MLVDAGFEEYSDRGMSDYSCSLGEWLSKEAREKLVKLSLKGLHEWSDNFVSCASRGRPRCSETMLAEAVGVSYRTVARWVSVGGVKACDVNSDRLAEVAFRFCPEETAVVLRGDVADYVRVVEIWLAGARGIL